MSGGREGGEEIKSGCLCWLSGLIDGMAEKRLCNPKLEWCWSLALKD